MRKIAVFITSLLSYLTLAPVASAQTTIDLCPKTGPFVALCNLNSSNFGGIVGTLLNLAFVVAIVIAVIYLIYGGIKWIMSKGDKAEVESARNHIVASITGLIVVFIAFFLINVVLGFFVPKANINTLSIPNITSDVCGGIDNPNSICVPATSCPTGYTALTAGNDLCTTKGQICCKVAPTPTPTK